MSGKIRNFFAALIILAGLGIFLWPTLSQMYIDWQAKQAMESIQQMRVTEPDTATIPQDTRETTDPTELTEPTLSEMDLLLQELVAYNEEIYREGQSNFKDPFSYQAAPIDLTAYGFDENIIGTIWIPRLEVELPLYLGATNENMAKGVAVLGETSLPVTGENTNVVIAGHRGYHGTAMFRDIQLIQLGDKITITTPWETLIYRVYELEIITPDQTDKVLIQPGRQILTLLTCHPYTQNYQRYLVRAELSDEEPEQDREEDLLEAEKTFDEAPREVIMSDESGNAAPMKVDPESIHPVKNEGTYAEGAASSNRMILLEKYAPVAVIGLLTVLILIKLLRYRREE